MDATITVWTVATKANALQLQPRASLFGHKNAVSVLAVSRTLSTILSASIDGEVILWDLNRLEMLRKISLPRRVDVRVLPTRQILTLTDIFNSVPNSTTRQAIFCYAASDKHFSTHLMGAYYFSSRLAVSKMIAYIVAPFTTTITMSIFRTNSSSPGTNEDWST